MKKIIKISFSILAVFLLVRCGEDNTVDVKVFSPQNQVIQTFTAELAQTTSERATGLMYRDSLGKNEGMLFIFPQVVQDSFWMKNTLIPLDMLFIDSQKRIVSIVHEAEPQTTTPRESEFPYQYVLEILGGRSEELGIVEGDRVEF